MKKKKLRDDEIIKALECCRDNERYETCNYCSDCPMNWTEDYDIEETNCQDTMLSKTLNLINRQKAEIERLKNLQNV